MSVDLVGKRLEVKTKEGRNLGLATYLYNGEILLDGGKKIHESVCTWKEVPPSEVPPFDIVLKKDTRVFEREGRGSLLNSGYWIKAGKQISIDEIEVCPWNHGGYVAGKFLYQGDVYWVLMSEVDLSREIPHLQPVG